MALWILWMCMHLKRLHGMNSEFSKMMINCHIGKLNHIFLGKQKFFEFANREYGRCVFCVFACM